MYFFILAVMWAVVWLTGFWYFRTRRTRGPLLRRLLWRGRTGVALGCIVIPTLYCLSYAPLRQYNLGMLDDLFVPVQWMIDQTPLREPLLWWAGFWQGVPDRLISDSAYRLRHDHYFYFLWPAPAWFNAVCWILFGLACALVPPFVAERAMHLYQTKWHRRADDAPAAV